MDESRLVAERFRVGDLEKDLLKRGGMGDVYRATDGRIGQFVAVKELDASIVARHPEALERFALTREALRQLDQTLHVGFVRAWKGSVAILCFWFRKNRARAWYFKGPVKDDEWRKGTMISWT